MDEQWARLGSRRLRDGVLELEGAWRGAAPARELRLRRRSDGLARAYPATVADGTFSAAVPLAALREAPPSLEAVATGTPGAHERWDVALGGLALRLPDAARRHRVDQRRPRRHARPHADRATPRSSCAPSRPVAAAAPAPAAPLSAPR